MAASIALLGSGKGTNVRAILEAIQKKEIDARVLAVISDKADSKVISIAREFKTPAFVHGELDTSNSLAMLLEKLRPRFLVLAGYMKLLPAQILKKYQDDSGFYRAVNIHPSLLPEYPGLQAYERAFKDRKKETGVTVHFVNPKVDAGPICIQEKFSIADCKSAEEVEERGKTIENRIYPQTLKWILSEQFDMVPGKQYQGGFLVRPR